MEKKKITRNDLPILKGIVEYIEIDGKKINLTPSNHSKIENFITHENCHDCGEEFEEKLKEFNSWLSRQDTHTWFPSNLRVNISDKLTLPDS